MSSFNLTIPIVVWGKEHPTHDISSILLTRDVKSIITGSRDGQICIWDFEPAKLKVAPRCLLVGHTAPVTCLAQGTFMKNDGFFVSSADNGEMCSWDLTDGRCLETLKLHNIHSNMVAYQMLEASDTRIFTIGNYPEILVYDPKTLELLFSLASQHQPDWISAFHLLRPPKRTDEVVLGLTTSGLVKVWTVSEKEIKPKEAIFEHESKIINSFNALCLVCCSFNQRTVLIVTQECWQIYDAGDFSLLCSQSAKPGETWLGGNFLTAEKVVIWTSHGKSFVYKLPQNCIVESRSFHNKQREKDNPVIINVIKCPNENEYLLHPPAWRFITIPTSSSTERLLIRGDCDGQIVLWRLMDLPVAQVEKIIAENLTPSVINPTLTHSMKSAWESMNPPPVGILDQLAEDENSPRVTASLFLPLQSRLVCGRDDGTIILVSATETVMLHLLHGVHREYKDWAQPIILHGHQGRINCLLYPYEENNRYNVAHLLSGGVDFSINVWDVYTGQMIHRFVVQAGPIIQLLVPPPNCTQKILNCICSVAGDHSVALVNMKDRKLHMLASQHLYPVVAVKWRPIHDFIMVSTQDGSLYIWQLETGCLDRVLQGVFAEEVWNHCDEHAISTSGASGADTGLVNPAVHFLRGLRHRNLAAIRHAAQRGIHHLLGDQNDYHEIHDFSKMRSSGLTVQGHRTNKNDSNSHVLFFDIEALIVQLLNEEYTRMTPEALEANELIMSNYYQKMKLLTHPASPEAAKKIAEFFGKVKDKAGEMEKKMKDKDKHGLLSRVKESAETVQSLIQHKGETGRVSPLTDQGNSDKVKFDPNQDSATKTQHVGQMIMSLLHSWGLDPQLDKICIDYLGMLKPRIPISYGLISRSGFMSLFMPTWHPVKDMPPLSVPSSGKRVSKELLELERLTKSFTSYGHWEISRALTTNHLLALVSVSNSLQNMTVDLKQQMINGNSHENEDAYRSMVKEGWSKLTALHTVLLPDIMENSKRKYKIPLVDMMSRRWQDRCQEVRDAAQALLKTELNRMGPNGRKLLIEEWAPHLPTYNEPLPASQSWSQMDGTPNDYSQKNSNEDVHNEHKDHRSASTTQDHIKGELQLHLEEEHDEEESYDGEKCRELVAQSENRRKQATAIILLGVIGAYYGNDPSEGFGVGNLSMKTSKALAYLVIAPGSSSLPLHTPIRRAAIDLIGRGFPIWEPYLDVAKILLSLLEFSTCVSQLAPSMKYGLPLVGEADSCRTSSNALTLIADARPSAFITTMAREVARYNAIQQNTQSLQMNLHNTVLYKAKTEILRVMDYLIQNRKSHVMNLMIEVMDVLLHCVDHGHLKNRGLNEVFPTVCSFPQVSHCSHTRRLAVGATNGSIAIYELRSGKCQVLNAHRAGVTAVAFSPEGKYMVSFSMKENKLSFWQTSSGIFGLGSSQTKCTKSFSTPPVPDIVSMNPHRFPRTIWISNKTAVLMMADGTEHRFNV